MSGRAPKGGGVWESFGISHKKGTKEKKTSVVAAEGGEGI